MIQPNLVFQANSFFLAWTRCFFRVLLGEKSFSWFFLVCIISSYRIMSYLYRYIIQHSVLCVFVKKRFHRNTWHYFIIQEPFPTPNYFKPNETIFGIIQIAKNHKGNLFREKMHSGPWQVQFHPQSETGWFGFDLINRSVYLDSNTKIPLWTMVYADHDLYMVSLCSACVCEVPPSSLPSL